MYLTIDDITKGMRGEVLAAITRNDNEVANQAIIEAQAEAAGYLAARYDIKDEYEKTAPPPGQTDDRNPLVVKLTRDIAIYNCHQFSAPVNMPATRVYAYEAAVKMLRDIQSEKAEVPGLARLVTTDGVVSSNYVSYSTASPKRSHHF
jgi:phage gp36-like protein